MPLPIVILDNGACSIKAGHASQDMPRIIPNCIFKVPSLKRRMLVGNQIESCQNTSGTVYSHSFKVGYMSNPDIQRCVWDYCFSRGVLNVDTSEARIIITEPQLNFTSLQQTLVEILFEDYEFKSVCRQTATQLADYYYFMTKKPTPRSRGTVCSIVVDSGYSFTHVIPYINGVKSTEAMKRIDVGGKVLTNRLRDIISYRQLEVKRETYLINQVKESVCYVSSDIYKDFEIAKKNFPKNTIVRDYVLPDYINHRKGYVRKTEEMGQRPKDGQQIIRMNNERFAIPEILFHPNDAGIQQMGITETISSVIETFPEQLKPHFYDNIVLIGGCATIPGFKRRVFKDVRSNADADFNVNVFLPDNPVTYAWEAAKRMSRDPEFDKYCVSREMFLEKGLNAFEGIVESESYLNRIVHDYD